MYKSINTDVALCSYHIVVPITKPPLLRRMIGES